MYIKVTWIHNFDDEPVLFYHELDDARMETRKIEFFKDETFQWASAHHYSDDIYLAEIPFPSVDEINEDPEFIAKEISQDEFEQIWIEYAHSANG